MTARRLLAVFAHPDDETFLTGGTLARHAAGGWEVTVVSATRGEEGRRGPYTECTVAEFGAVREAELREAAETLGVRDVIVLGYPDGGVRANGVAVEYAVVDIILTRRPDIIVTFGPDGVSGHDDHIAISEIVTRAARHVAPARVGAEGGRDAPARLYYVLRSSSVPSCCTPKHAVATLPVTTVVDVSGVGERKLRAMRVYVSQAHLLPSEGGLAGVGREPERFHRWSPTYVSTVVESIPQLV